MSGAERFILYNFLPGLAAGALAWAVIVAGIHLLGIRHGKLRLCLLTAPLLKSTLVMLGIGLVLPFPADIFGAWNARAFGTTEVLPFFLIAAALAMAGRGVLRRRSRMAALRDATPAGADHERLRVALDEVMLAFEERRQEILARCGCEPGVARPDLSVSRAKLASPLVVPGKRPMVVFPERLVARLSDAALRGVLAHEIAHTLLRQPASCFSSDTVQTLSVANPMAAAMAAQLHREEEKACDDMAIEVLGDPDTYAEMLIACYRFARATARAHAPRLQFVPQLLGFKPSLAERIERLVEDSAPAGDMARQWAGFGILWALIIAAFFTG